MSKCSSTLISLFYVFLSSTTIEGMKLMKSSGDERKMEIKNNPISSNRMLKERKVTRQGQGQRMSFNKIKIRKDCWQNMSSLKKEVSCQWQVVSDTQVVAQEFPTLEEFQKIVNIIDEKGFSQEVREQFYGKQDNFRVIALIAVIVIAVVGIGIFFCLKNNIKKIEKSEK